MSDTRVRMTLDLHRPGKAVGEILVPIWTNDSAYGVIPIPIVVINGGAGACHGNIGLRKFLDVACPWPLRPRVGLRDEARAGDVLGHVHSLEDYTADSAATRAKTSGIVICRRGEGLVAAGDCAAIVAHDFVE